MALVEIDGKINTGNKSDQAATVKLNFAYDKFDFKNVEGDDNGETFQNKVDGVKEAASLHAGANVFVGREEGESIGEYREIVGGQFNVNKNSNDFGALLEEVFGDGVAGVTATQVGSDEVRFEIEGKGGSTDTINLCGEYVSTFLSANGLGFGSGGGMNLGNKTSQTAFRDFSDPNLDGNLPIGGGATGEGTLRGIVGGAGFDAEVDGDHQKLLEAFAAKGNFATIDDLVAGFTDTILIDADKTGYTEDVLDFGEVRLTDINEDSYTIEAMGKDDTVDTATFFDYDLLLA